MDSSPITALHAKLRGLRVAIDDDCVFDFDEQRLWRQGAGW